MIINHSYKFIFFANRKTASTSIAIALSSSCSKKDVITPLGRDEKIRSNLQYQGPTNFIPLRNKLKYFYIEASCKLRKKPANDLLKQVGLHTHISPQEALDKKYIDEKLFNSYYKFCFIRNPWDLTISQFHWRNRPGKKTIDLDTFINEGALENWAKQSRSIYTKDGHTCMDRICKYENAQTEINEIFELLHLKGQPELPKSKHKIRRQKRDPKDILTSQQIEKIRSIFEPEIELGKYSI